MYLVVLCLFTLNLKPSSSQLPDHMDLQKVGETIFNNEKYNILKPTTHIISDYFKDFVLRRDNINFPTSRIFLDDNGFRHYWNGFDKKTKSLRKTEILSDAIETVTVKSEEKTTNNSNETHNSTEKVNSTDISGEFNNSSKPSFRTKNTNSNSTETTNDVSEIKENTANNKKPTNSSDGKVATISEGNDIKVYKHIYKHKKKETIISENTVVTSNDVNLRGGPASPVRHLKKTVATTTFFCPYFGVITMSAFID